MENMEQNTQTAEHDAAQAESGANEKRFSQEEVNKIIAERLARKKTDADLAVEELASQKEELAKREHRLACREYLAEQKYPYELLELISAETVEEFKNKADKIRRLSFNKLAPLASTEPMGIGVNLTSAFNNTKRKPKGLYYED